MKYRCLLQLAGMLTTAGVLCAGSSDIGAAEEELAPAVQAGVQRVEDNQVAQQRIDVISDDIRDKVEEYKALMKQIENLGIYNEQLQAQLDSQDIEIAELGSSIDNVTLIERQITPLMLRMIDALEQFVALDMPFLPEERSTRIGRLKDMIGRSDVGVAEKFRAVFDAYQTEMEYGRTIEAYRGMLSAAEGGREVDFLRVGRIGLYYMSLDGSLLGAWNPDTREWETLPGGYRAYITDGLRIAREQAAPDLIKLPIPKPESAS